MYYLIRRSFTSFIYLFVFTPKFTLFVMLILSVAVIGLIIFEINVCIPLSFSLCVCVHVCMCVCVYVWKREKKVKDLPMIYDAFLSKVW